jgi:hypothetical protein
MRTNEKGSFLVGSLGSSCRYKKFMFCLGCSSRPSIISSPYTTYFNLFVPIAQQDWQAAALGRLSLSVCLWVEIIWTSKNIPLLTTVWPNPVKFMSISALAPMWYLPINESAELNLWSLYINQPSLWVLAFIVCGKFIDTVATHFLNSKLWNTSVFYLCIIWRRQTKIYWTT